MFQTKFGQKIKTRISENCASYKIMLKKYGTARRDTNVNKTRRMRFAYRTNKAIDRHTEYVTFISFLWQQSLRRRSSILTLWRRIFFFKF